MVPFDEYTRESPDAMHQADEIIIFEPLDDDPFLLGAETEERDDLRFLAELGIGKPYIEAFGELARTRGTTLEEEMLADGFILEDAYFGSFARYLRLPFMPELDAAIIVDTPSLETQLIECRMVRLSPRTDRPYIAIVPDLETITRLKQSLDAMPSVALDLVVTTPKALRRAVWEAGAERRTRQTVNQLFDSNAVYSARIILEGGQGLFIGAGVALVAMSLMLWAATIHIVHIVTAVLYTAAMLYRISPLQTAPQRNSLIL